ncbi:MAG: alpha-hydroxy acid oxidase [Planctomycetales bacterium]|jgi:isopentenyl diphosphate isomerase/L-lactate dehydrogenase-like FMN-dependent dehydrogenase
MDRRTFSQLLAFGAGMFSAAHVDGKPAVADEASSDDAGKPGPSQKRDAGHNAWPASPVTISDFIPLAKAKLPKATFEYITSGSEDEVTLRDNVEAFRRMRILPPLLHGVQKTDLSTTVLGQKISMPIMLAPVAALRMFHPEGGRASARAAASAGTICIASTSVGNSVEEIAAAGSGPKWFQLYVPSDRELARQLVKRAETAGYKALVVTVDLGERKDADLRNRFSLPKDILLKHLRDIGHTEVSDRNTYDELVAFNAKAWDVSLSVDFFQWLRRETKLPIILKGVLTKEAAQQAIDLKLDGIVVSNHGGRRLDGMPASIDMLKEVVAAADGQLEVLFDSGVRRGGDVLKALALGAKAVMIGRPQAWSLAAGGETGVKLALEILRDELTNSMVSAGFATVDDVNESILLPTSSS